jgi:hypothetical protein
LVDASLGRKFRKKEKEILSMNSRLWLNKYLSKLEQWDIQALENRFAQILKRFLKIWKIPTIQIIEVNEDEVNIFDAEDPTNKKLEYIIFLGEKIIVSDFSEFYAKILKALFEQDSSKFFNTDLHNKNKIKLTYKDNPDKSKLRLLCSITDNYMIDTHSSNIEKFKNINMHLKYLI